MARKTTSTPSKPEPALLVKPREEVRAQILARIEMVKQIVSTPVQSGEGLDAVRAAYKKWDEYNSEFLRRAFTTTEYAEEYNWFGMGVVAMRQQSLGEQANELSKRIIQKRDRLTSLVERLDLIDEQPGVSAQLAAQPVVPRVASTDTNKVFLVHGQDDAAKAIVARFISGCGLEPIILHEQANGGRTIIEKFEKEADVGFAVILLTPDDVGGIRRGNDFVSDELKLRARQNVILELGYFAGRLGRDRVAALKKGDVELPSDIAGVVWTPMDGADAWKMSLARELKNAGYDFDVAKALGI